jgi:phage repressor protein C with HTH and peptisase S24 domain
MRRLGLTLGAAFLFVGIARIAGDRLTRIAVSGHSMEPGLRDGDWLVVDRQPRSWEPLQIVVARDPRASGRLIVKRIGSVTPDHELVLVSDHRAHADDRIGPVRGQEVVGRVAFRYWPPSRAGRVG